jgi:hypothetical protein
VSLSVRGPGRRPPAITEAAGGDVDDADRALAGAAVCEAYAVAQGLDGEALGQGDAIERTGAATGDARGEDREGRGGKVVEGV